MLRAGSSWAIVLNFATSDFLTVKGIFSGLDFVRNIVVFDDCRFGCQDLKWPLQISLRGFIRLVISWPALVVVMELRRPGPSIFIKRKSSDVFPKCFSFASRTASVLFVSTSAPLRSRSSHLSWGLRVVH